MLFKEFADDIFKEYNHVLIYVHPANLDLRVECRRSWVRIPPRAQKLIFHILLY